MRPIKLALDWTPNTLHAGFLIALHKGYYKKAGFNVSLVSPEADNYKLTPARRVARQKADFGIAPSESVISYATAKSPVPLTAVATLLQKDMSAIATVAGKGIERPADLDGKTYASYNARFEDAIIKQLVINDGGEGTVIPKTFERLGIWDTLLEGKADSTWIFTAWEGVEAKLKGVELKLFNLVDHGIPYGYSPVVITHKTSLYRYRKYYKNFMAVSAEAYQEASAEPANTADFLCEVMDHENFKNPEMIHESLKVLSRPFLNEQQKWGRMEGKFWGFFLNWLVDNDILKIKKPLDWNTLYTNELF